MKWPDRFHERVHTFAHGPTFDVDAFLATSAIRPDFVWRREAPITSGVEFFLGDGRAIRIRDQQEIAITFLKAHRDQLRALGQFSGLDSFLLGLVYIAQVDSAVSGACLDWNPELMSHALDVGITPAYYITYDRG